MDNHTHLHVMTGDQKFLLHELSPPTFSPLSSLSPHFYPRNMLHKHTQKFTHILFSRRTHTRHTFLLYFPDTHSHPYTLFTHIHCCSLPGSLKERTKHPHPNSYHQFLPTTTRANRIRKFGKCVLLYLHPLSPSLVKGSFGCSLSVKRKKGEST